MKAHETCCSPSPEQSLGDVQVVFYILRRRRQGSSLNVTNVESKKKGDDIELVAAGRADA